MSLFDPLHGNGYSFWSGIGNDLPIWFFGVAPIWWHKNNCHQKRCWRISRHLYNGTPYCTKHKPTDVDNPSQPDTIRIVNHLIKKEDMANQKHPGFKAVQKAIARKQGISSDAAGAILASRTRKASAAAKAKNPRLNRVKGKAK